MNSSSSNPMTEAIRLTTRTIDRRAASHRNLVITVVAIVLFSIITAGIMMSWLPLIGILSLAPVCGLFFYWDTHTVYLWQKQILKLWQGDVLDLNMFSKAIATISTLPQHTLKGMLITLPITDNFTEGIAITLNYRPAVVAIFNTIAACQKDYVLNFTLCSLFVIVTISCALIQGSSYLLIVLIFAIPLFQIGKRVCLIRLSRFKHEIKNKKENDFDIRQFIKIADNLDWGNIPEKQKKYFLFH